MILRFSLFLVTAALILAALHYWIWIRLLRDPAWPAPAARIGAVVLGALCLALPFAFMLRRTRPPIGTRLAQMLFTWLGVCFVLVTAVALTDLVRFGIRGVLWLWQRFSGEALADDPGRRIFIARSLAGVALATASGATAVGAAHAMGTPQVREVPVKLGRLPRALEGLSIVQLSDLHIDRSVEARFCDEVVARTNSLKPDVVVITGDLVDGSVPAISDRLAALGRLATRYGVFFAPGNHDHYSGLRPWLIHLPKLNIRPLVNERVAIGDRQGPGLDLAGIDDFTGDPDLDKALAGRDPERELVLLSHQPRAIAQAAASGVGLQLSGHTHGGQIWPWGLVVRLQQPYLAGLHKHTARTQIYVSRGTGFWGPPIRLGAPAEITKIILIG